MDGHWGNVWVTGIEAKALQNQLALNLVAPIRFDQRTRKMAVDQDDWLGKSIRRCRPAANGKVVKTGDTSFGRDFRIVISSTFGSPWKTMRERLPALSNGYSCKTSWRDEYNTLFFKNGGRFPWCKERCLEDLPASSVLTRLRSCFFCKRGTNSETEEYAWAEAMIRKVANCTMDEEPNMVCSRASCRQLTTDQSTPWPCF